MIDPEKVKRVLIFRTGSLGDTVVALPCFHLIARSFPQAEKRILTARTFNPRAVTLTAVLENSGLIDDFIYYSSNQKMKDLPRVWKQIRSWAPDVFIYLAAPRGLFSAWRDAAFFKLCGIKRFIGVPYTKSLQENQWLSDQKVFEHESERLGRCLKELGDIRIGDPRSWDLHLTGVEKKSAEERLQNWPGKKMFIVSSVVPKVKTKDWGEENWSRLFGQLSENYPDLGMVMIGAQVDAEPSERIARQWKGPFLNLCGVLNVRESAAVIQKALFFLGHDSGPMHLAASLRVSCVAVFCHPKKPDVWFPYGNGHRVLISENHGRSPLQTEGLLTAVQELLEKNPEKR